MTYLQMLSEVEQNRAAIADLLTQYATLDAAIAGSIRAQETYLAAVRQTVVEVHKRAALADELRERLAELVAEQDIDAADWWKQGTG